MPRDHYDAAIITVLPVELAAVRERLKIPAESRIHRRECGKMRSWFEKFYLVDVLPKIVDWAGLAVYFLGVALCYKIGSWIPLSDFGNWGGIGLILGVFFLGGKLRQIYIAWVFGWKYENAWNEPPPGRD